MLGTEGKQCAACETDEVAEFGDRLEYTGSTGVKRAEGGMSFIAEQRQETDRRLVQRFKDLGLRQHRIANDPHR